MSGSNARKIFIGSTATLLMLAGAIIFLKDRGKKVETPVAPLADVKICGDQSEEKKMGDQVLARLAANVGELSPDGKIALIRNLEALPDRVTKTLTVKKVRVALESVRSNLRCSAPGTGGGVIGQGASCLKATPQFGDVLIIASNPGLDSEGKPLKYSDRDIIDTKMLPLLFWSMFENFWGTAPESSLLEENTPSRANNFARIKRYVTESLKIGPGEEDFYREEFGGSGVKSPIYQTRTLALLAANLYCSQEAYKQLNSSQPEAVKRFMGTFGCALGKPWHQTETEFSALCSDKT